MFVLKSDLLLEEIKKLTSSKLTMPESLYTVLVSHLKVILFFTERKKANDESI